jgi:acetolactate synthase-1/2/3 large subunit
MLNLPSPRSWFSAAPPGRDLVPAVQKALSIAQEGVPGPVFVECPVDVLYDEELVRDMYGAKATQGKPRGLADRALRWYLGRHLDRLFAGQEGVRVGEPVTPKVVRPSRRSVARTARFLARANQPVLMIGSQATLGVDEVGDLAQAVERMGVPVYLSGMARGLLGAGHPLQMRHQRRQALREADVVLLAGVPCDFRLDYGRQINRQANLIAVNRSAGEVRKNRRPTLSVVADPGFFLRELATMVGDDVDRTAWVETLRQRDDERMQQIDESGAEPTEFVNPLALCAEIEKSLDDDSVLVADGGDFVATASYIVSPRAPLSWLDPGVFGTLGVGAGFALGAKLCRPESEVWILYGDGSCAYSLAEFDTFVRHELPVIAVVGNDASWAQIARDQVELLQDDVGTVLERTNYHVVAEGFGGKGFRLVSGDQSARVLQAAKTAAAVGQPVLVNALLGKTDFRKGSISL